jgi:hypothetical protein
MIQRVSAESVQMRLVPGADLKGHGVHFQKVLLREPVPQSLLDPIARQQNRAAVCMPFRVPPRGFCCVGHDVALSV